MVKSRYLTILLTLTNCVSLLSMPMKQEPALLNRLARNKQLQASFKPFFDIILTQINGNDFFYLLNSIVSKYQPDTQEEWYKLIADNIDSIKPFWWTYASLQALEKQKKALTAHTKQLLSERKKIDGYLEIGTPGTYINSIKSAINITGPKYVLHEKQIAKDRLLAGSFSPSKQFWSYNKFIPLDQYNPISSKDIPDNSVDLVTCFIGLHHITEEKLDAFIASIRRILRPGGIFILRDHDCHNDTVITMAYLAHTVFNIIVANDSLQDEQKEYRNFQPLTHWITTLERHHFKVGPERLVQNGDPTLNTMIAFTKQATNKQESQIEASHALFAQDKQRNFAQTYLTAPEWLSVDISKKEAEFVKNKPFYQFPYFKHVGLLWNTFFQSWKQARKTNSFFDLISSDYTQMNFFICAMTSAKYITKGIVSSPLALFGTNTPHEVQQQMANTTKQYSDFIEHTPFYEFAYFENLKRIWRVFGQSMQRKQKTDGIISALGQLVTSKELPSLGIASAEYIADGLISAPLRLLFSGVETSKITLLIEDSHDELSRWDNRIVLTKNFQDNLKMIEVPRYMQFLDILTNTPPHITILEIAGNKSIQLKVRYHKNTLLNYQKLECTKEYEWQLPTEPEYQYSMLIAQVSKLPHIIKELTQQGVEVIYIHDF